MVEIPTKVTGAVTRQNVTDLNTLRAGGVYDRSNITSINYSSHRNTSGFAADRGAAAGGARAASPGAYQTPQQTAAGGAYAPGNQQAAGAYSSGGQQTMGGYASGQQQTMGAYSSGGQQQTMGAYSSGQQQPARVIARITPPRIENPALKGQKILIEKGESLKSLKACIGWNVNNPECDVDVSAFLLSGGRVPGDDWFVFYSQPQSPDKSVNLSVSGGQDRQRISIDLTMLNPAVDKIVFVLTINEALEKRLNFSMVSDAYIRILDGVSDRELTGFMMDEYYENVTSMMIGELYRHNGLWKFNAVGNGVAKDLAGLCGMYGVQVD